jgi:murein DD-endopeptidase MepM/ murein hydrolase activator NlpD
MHLFVALLLLVSLLFAQASIDQKISNTNKRLKSFDSTYKNINQDMKANAKEILEQNRAVLTQQNELQKLQEELDAKETLYKTQKSELASLQNSQEDLQKAQNEIEERLAFAIAKNTSLALLLDEDRAKNDESLITEEALKLLARLTKEEIKSLETSYSGNNENILALQKRVKELRLSIGDMEKRQYTLKLAYEANKKALQNLNSKTAQYEASLDKLLKEQKALQSTLGRLEIIKAEELKAQEREKQERIQAQRASKEATIAQKERENMLASATLPKVKQVGTSYQRVKTMRYRGKKTIAPLDAYSVTKTFGPYTDPIYNIKIFNESISLKPKEPNAKVKNILNGKVVMAQETPMLSNVVIIEHADGLHTIYAHLDQIAPTIQTGKKIRKGSIIGRVSNELMFEVTKKNYHIDPLQLIN